MGQFMRDFLAKNYSWAEYSEGRKQGILIGKAINALVSLLIFMIEDHCLLSLRAESGVFLQRNRKLQAHRKCPFLLSSDFGSE